MGPSQLGDAPYTATAANEEISGPLVLVDAGDIAKQAVEIANRTQYGLTSSTLSGDTPRGFELAPNILRGSVNVKLADSDRRDSRADGRRAQQRLGTDGFEMPRRFQRRHLDRGAATVTCLNNVRRDDTVLGSAAA
jgi:Aldehyde dehydrogenase family